MSSNKFFTKGFILAGIFVFLGSIVVAWYINSSRSGSNSEFTAANGNIIDSVEIAMIYFGCSTCVAATDDSLPRLISEVSKTMEKKLRIKNKRYTTIGISNETNQLRGVKYLQSILTFDEVALGNGMRNTGIQKYVWETYDGQYSGATPQIIISKRIYHSTIMGNELNVEPDIKTEKILKREVGASNIKKLLDDDYLDKIFSKEV